MTVSPEQSRGQASRARWGIETVVVQDDPFAFIEIIKRLQAGAVVALLLDHPLPSGAVAVELFGRSLWASSAAALLARLSRLAGVAPGPGLFRRLLPLLVQPLAHRLTA